jgi:hypothetical protein
MGYLQNFVNVQNGDKLGAKNNGKDSWIRLSFGTYAGGTLDDGKTTLLYKGKSVLDLSKRDIENINGAGGFEIAVRLNSNFTAIAGKTSYGGNKTLTFTHEVGLHVQAIAGWLNQYKNGDLTADQLIDKFKASANDEKGTEHWQIKDGENKLYEQMNDDVERTIEKNPDLDYGEVITVQYQDQRRTWMHLEKQAIEMLSEQFRKQRDFEKTVEYNPASPFSPLHNK